jgi:5-formyltetrahydrofolate cyclo-ligase
VVPSGEADEASEKRRLRAELSSLLHDLPEDAPKRAGLCIARLLGRRADWVAAAEIGLFASLTHEVDTGPILEMAWSAGKRVLLPRMVGGSDLEFVPVEDLASLVVRRHGVREPAPGRPGRSFRPGAMLFVPGVAFDRRGGRLGRGAGYYDRALARIARGAARPRFVGVGFDVQIVDRVPMTEFDVFMDAVVTESEWIEREVRR